MARKLIILSLFGLIMMLLLSVVFTVSEIGIKRKGEADTKFFEYEDMSTSTIESISQPISVVEVTSSTASTSQHILSFSVVGEGPAFVDVFVIEGETVSGKNSRTGKEAVGRGVRYWEEQSNTEPSLVSFGKHAEVKTMAEHIDVIDVYVVGLATGQYQLSGMFRDASGREHPLMYTMDTNEGVVDSYHFDYKSGSISTSSLDHLIEDTEQRKSGDIDGECDNPALQTQLESELGKRGWEMEAVPLVEKVARSVANIDGVSRPLPFNYQRVCSVTMVFREEYEDEIPREREYRTLVHDFSNKSARVVVGGTEFTTDPADGPLGSSNVIPLTQTGNELQLLLLNEQTSLIPVGYPLYSVCPCSFGYRATLTAPMRPEGE